MLNRKTLKWNQLSPIAGVVLGVTACGAEADLGKSEIEHDAKALQVVEQVLESVPDFTTMVNVSSFEDRYDDTYEFASSSAVREHLNIHLWTISGAEDSDTGATLVDVEAWGEASGARLLAVRINLDRPQERFRIRVLHQELLGSDPEAELAAPRTPETKALLRLVNLELEAVFPGDAPDGSIDVGEPNPDFRTQAQGLRGISRWLCAFYTAKFHVDIYTFYGACIASIGEAGFNPIADAACLIAFASLYGDITSITNYCGSAPHIPSWALPPGSYRRSCNLNSCAYKTPAVTLECDCTRRNGSSRRSSKRLSSSCAGFNRIHNCDGVLTCGGGC